MRLWIFALALPLAAAVTGAEGPNAFAVDLYSKVSRQPGNLVFSPFSVSTALAMALTGARGQTAAEMRSVLRNPPDAALLDQLSKAAGTDQLSLAQSLWVDR